MYSNVPSLTAPAATGLGTTAPPPLSHLPVTSQIFTLGRERRDIPSGRRCFSLVDDPWSASRPRPKIVVYEPCDKPTPATARPAFTSPTREPVPVATPTPEPARPQAPAGRAPAVQGTGCTRLSMVMHGPGLSGYFKLVNASAPCPGSEQPPSSSWNPCRPS